MEHSVQVGLLLARIAGSEPRARLKALTQLRRELDSIETELAADALRAGHSWREIGAALGVSKQAAHRRHSHGVALIDRAAETEHRGSRVIISEEVRTAVRIARREAAATGGQTFGTEHLLLGLLQCGDEATIAVLERVGVTLGVVRGAIQPTTDLSPGAAALPGAGAVEGNGQSDGSRRPAVASPLAGQTPDGSRRRAVASPLARQTLGRALPGSSRRASQALTAIDLLRAVLNDEHGGAAQTLERLGVEPQVVQAEIERVVT